MITILVSAAAGALGAIIAYVIFRGEHRKQLRLFATVVLIIVFAKLGDYYVAKPFEAEKALRDLPAFEAIKEHEPATYQQIRAEMLRAVRGGADRANVTAKIRAHTSEIVSKYIPRASDKALTDYIAVTVEEIRQLAAKSPEEGVKFLFPAPGESVDLVRYVDAQTRQRDLSALGELIRTGAASPPRPIDQARAQQLLDQALAQLRSKYGDSVAALAAPRAPGTDKKMVCDMAADLYAFILEMPSSDAALVLRSMLTGA